ncbi:transglutaminase family protein [Methylosinus sp. LW4]|uniref:transglutaminase family protein n=1 Tax=Methylosinus sp. LW4 TaxID=136993 RepID=UPI00036AEEC3|nr:transglutaminase family protein [Methylosinus sp. LW4]
MHIRVRRETIYRYAEPAKAAIQKLALTPRNYDGQHVLDWRIDVDRDCRLRACEDAFGNVVHSIYVEGPLEALTTVVEGAVETFDTAGVARGAIERFPPELYLRETPLTEADHAICDFALAATAREKETLAKLHALVGALHEAFVVAEEPTSGAVAASDIFARRRGSAQDAAHVFIAGARSLEIPSRYVSGYALRADAGAAVHAWAEAHVAGLGWVGFDPTRGASPDESYVRVAVALDHLGAAPIRAAHSGGGDETAEVRVSVARAQGQSQSQS